MTHANTTEPLNPKADRFIDFAGNLALTLSSGWYWLLMSAAGIALGGATKDEDLFSLYILGIPVFGVCIITRIFRMDRTDARILRILTLLAYLLGRHYFGSFAAGFLAILPFVASLASPFLGVFGDAIATAGSGTPVNTRKVS